MESKLYVVIDNDEHEVVKIFKTETEALNYIKYNSCIYYYDQLELQTYELSNYTPKNPRYEIKLQIDIDLSRNYYKFVRNSCWLTDNNCKDSNIITPLNFITPVYYLNTVKMLLIRYFNENNFNKEAETEKLIAIGYDMAEKIINNFREGKSLDYIKNLIEKQII